MFVPFTRRSRTFGVVLLSGTALVATLLAGPARRASAPRPTACVTLRFQLPADATPAERHALVGEEVRLDGYDPDWIHCGFGAQEEPRWHARIRPDRTVTFDRLHAAHWTVAPYRDVDGLPLGRFVVDADFVFVVDRTEPALSVRVPLERGPALQCGTDPPR
ncbi:MAG: hypothetical protein AAGB93_05275 [Planctomycetota bacterium]